MIWRHVCDLHSHGTSPTTSPAGVNEPLLLGYVHLVVFLAAAAAPFLNQSRRETDRLTLFYTALVPPLLLSPSIS